MATRTPGGVGLVLRPVSLNGDRFAAIHSLAEHGAAKRDGKIEVGDVIASVDGSPAVGLTVPQVQALVIGEVGSQCTIGIMRPADGSMFGVNLVRSVLPSSLAAQQQQQQGRRPQPQSQRNDSVAPGGARRTDDVDAEDRVGSSRRPPNIAPTTTAPATPAAAFAVAPSVVGGDYSASQPQASSSSSSRRVMPALAPITTTAAPSLHHHQQHLMTLAQGAAPSSPSSSPLMSPTTPSSRIIGDEFDDTIGDVGIKWGVHKVRGSTELVVARMAKAGPAFACGRIHLGDTLLRIDEVPVSTPEEAQRKSRGPIGTPCTMQLVGCDDGYAYEVSVMRVRSVERVAARMQMVGAVTSAVNNASVVDDGRRGVGILLVATKSGLCVSAVVRGGPAHVDGRVRAGDILLEIDGVAAPVSGGVSAARERIIGKIGTRCSLTLYRSVDNSKYTVHLLRRQAHTGLKEGDIVSTPAVAKHEVALCHPSLPSPTHVNSTCDDDFEFSLSAWKMLNNAG